MKTPNLLEPKQRKAFRDKYLAAVFAVGALFISSLAGAQLDSAKYSPINGYGFKYKRHVQDSLAIMPLSNSPHIPYRKGGYRYNITDTCLELWTGTQWIPDNRATQLTDSTFLVGHDTITIRGTGGTNIANAALTANGDYTQNWNHFQWYIDSISGITWKINEPSTYNALNRFRYIKNISNNIGNALQEGWTLEDQGGFDSLSYNVLSNYLGTSLVHQGGNTLSQIELNGGFTTPEINIQTFGSGSNSLIKVDKKITLNPTDSLRLKAIPAATADSVLGVRAYASGLNTVVKFPVPSGTSGVTTMAAIGSTPNANAATISGSTLTLQPTNGQYGGIINTDTQTIAGSKFLIAKHNTIMGFAPRLQTQLAPTEDISTEFSNGRYMGFGFAGVTNSGKYFMIYADAINHVGDSSKIKMSKSSDQGKTWDTTVIISGPGGGNHWVSMGAGGVTGSGRIIAAYFDFDKTTIGASDNVTTAIKIKYSDDEGTTWSSPFTISLGSTINNQLPYGPMIRIGGDSLLISWYGITAGGNEVYVIKSGDDGATWGSNILVSNDYATQRDESSFTYIGGSTIIGLLRGETTTYKQVKSTDNGNTWTDQGNVSFGTSGTPPWTRSYIDVNGQRVMVCYFKNGGLYSISGYASDIISGPSGWKSSTLQQLISTVAGNNYINIVHPDNSPYGFGYYYRETVALTSTAIDFIKVPKDNFIPLPKVFTSTIGIGGTPTSGVDLHINKTTDAYIYLTGGNANFVMGANAAPGTGDYAAFVRNVSSGGNLDISNDSKKIRLSTSISGGYRSDFQIASSGYIGIGNNVGTPATRLDIAGANAKAGSPEDIFQLRSSDASNYLGLNFSIGNNSSSGSRYLGLQGFEGAGFKTLALNPFGGFVGINNTAPDAYLAIKGAQAKAGSEETIATFNSSDASQPLSLWVNIGNNATSGSRGIGLQAIESGSGYKNMWLNPDGANVLIGTRTNNTYKLQVNGAISTVTDSAASPVNMAWIDTDGKIRKAAVPGGGATLASGTYTPTLTNESNITASTAYQCQYMRVGNTVTVSGKINIDYTATGSATLGISLPIASDIANDNEVAGTMNAEVNNGGVIRGDATNNRAQFYINTGSSAGYDYFFTFTYQIL